jgi:Tol biopolymer transport system component
VIESTAVDREPALSPDGRRLLFTSDRSGSREVYVADSDGSNQVALTAIGPTYNGSPHWSPDGRTVAFDRYENGYSVIYTVPSEGGAPRRMTDEPFGDTRPRYSRDGNWIYFASTRSGPNEIWKIPSKGGAPRQVTHNSATEAFESPDGRVLYYANSQGIWALPLAGGEASLIVPEARSSWTVAGNSIYYLIPSDLSRPGAVWVFRGDSGRKFEYVRFPAELMIRPRGPGITVAPDERTVMYSLDVRTESDLMLVDNFR